jgi:hypothetical protein
MCVAYTPRALRATVSRLKVQVPGHAGCNAIQQLRAPPSAPLCEAVVGACAASATAWRGVRKMSHDRGLVAQNRCAREPPVVAALCPSNKPRARSHWNASAWGKRRRPRGKQKQRSCAPDQRSSALRASSGLLPRCDREVQRQRALPLTDACVRVEVVAVALRSCVLRPAVVARLQVAQRLRTRDASSPSAPKSDATRAIARQGAPWTAAPCVRPAWQTLRLRACTRQRTHPASLTDNSG